MCWTDYEAQSDPQTGSPPREKVGSAKLKQMSEFDNFLQEANERKNKLFRSAASATKKKNSLSIGTDVCPSVESITVCTNNSPTYCRRICFNSF